MQAPPASLLLCTHHGALSPNQAPWFSAALQASAGWDICPGWFCCRERAGAACCRLAAIIRHEPSWHFYGLSSDSRCACCSGCTAHSSVLGPASRIQTRARSCTNCAASSISNSSTGNAHRQARNRAIGWKWRSTGAVLRESSSCQGLETPP
jgi:hypothetical protein